MILEAKDAHAAPCPYVCPGERGDRWVRQPARNASPRKPAVHHMLWYVVCLLLVSGDNDRMVPLELLLNSPGSMDGDE